MKNKSIVVILVLMLLALIFVMPISARSSIPIEIALTAEPSTITTGERSTVTVRLLNENKEPVVTEENIHVNLSTDIGWNSSMIIPAGNNSSSTEFISYKPGVAVISAKSKGLISDTVSIAVLPKPMSIVNALPPLAAPTIEESEPEAEETPRLTEPTSKEPGFETLLAIAGLFTVTYLLRRRE